MTKESKVDRWLFATTAGLALFGIVMVYSSSAVRAAAENNNQYHYVLRQGLWTAIGFLAMLGAMNFDYQRLRDRRFVYPMLVVTAVLLVAVFGFPRINGAHRWIKFRGASLQPSEFSKLVLAIFLAYFLEKRAGEEQKLLTTFVPCMSVMAVLAAVIVVEPDLGTAMMLAVIAFVVLYVAGARILHLTYAAMPALIMITGLLVFVPYRIRRLVVFMDPWADPQGDGYQIVQSLIAFGSGGVNGLGFAQSKQKMFFLPFGHSDFIFSIVGEELGLVGALIVVFLFGVLMWRGIRTALNAPDRFGMLLATGIVTCIVAQALFNMSVVLSLVPNKGIPLPFISYGGSSLVPTLAAVGVLLNISQQSEQGESITRRFIDSAKAPRPVRRGEEIFAQFASRLRWRAS
jgi:cell division protein FtsW